MSLDARTGGGIAVLWVAFSYCDCFLGDWVLDAVEEEAAAISKQGPLGFLGKVFPTGYD